LPGVVRITLDPSLSANLPVIPTEATSVYAGCAVEGPRRDRSKSQIHETQLLAIGSSTHRLASLPLHSYDIPPMNPILVIGATGTVGLQVVSQLSTAGAKIRAMARHPEAAKFSHHVEVVRGDLTAPETLDPCLDGVEKVFLVWTAPPTAVGPALQRVSSHARRIVVLSAPLKTLHPLFQQPNPLRTMMEQIERFIETSGLQWTFLRPGMFAANAVSWWAPQIRTGDVVRWPFLAVPTAPIDERDIASVAVRALTEDGHAGAEYVLTGPQSLTHLEQISTIARVLGRSLRIEEISPEEARRELLPIMPLGAVNMLLQAWAAAASHPAHLTSTFAQITGAAPKTFLDWTSANVAEFRD